MKKHSPTNERIKRKYFNLSDKDTRVDTVFRDLCFAVSGKNSFNIGKNSYDD